MSELESMRATMRHVLRGGPMHVDGAADHAAPLVLAMLDEARAEGRREGLRSAAERLRLWSSTLEAVADSPTFLAGEL